MQLLLGLTFAVIGIFTAHIFGLWLMKVTSKENALLGAIVLGRIILHITKALEDLILS